MEMHMTLWNVMQRGGSGFRIGPKVIEAEGEK
jgi:hypothetical protein